MHVHVLSPCCVISMLLSLFMLCSMLGHQHGQSQWCYVRFRLSTGWHPYRNHEADIQVVGLHCHVGSPRQCQPSNPTGIVYRAEGWMVDVQRYECKCMPAAELSFP